MESRASPPGHPTSNDASLTGRTPVPPRYELSRRNSSQRPQEVKDVLNLGRAERFEVVDHGVSF
jgi:hypothetical protein